MLFLYFYLFHMDHQLGEDAGTCSLASDLVQMYTGILLFVVFRISCKHHYVRRKGVY